MKKNLSISILMLSVCFALFSSVTGFAPFYQGKPWDVPDAAKNKKNPVASNAESIATGKELWSTHCKSCHGTKGLGDGTKAAQLKTEPGNFTIPAFQGQTDGALFYKTSEGRDDMPSFKKKIPDEDDRWALVNFMRSLKK